MSKRTEVNCRICHSFLHNTKEHIKGEEEREKLDEEAEEKEKN